MSRRGAVKQKIKEINENPDATDKDDDLKTTLEVCYEFYLRGFHFEAIDLYESDALKFNIRNGKLLPAVCVGFPGLGETAAWDIVEGRKGKRFISIEEFAAACSKSFQDPHREPEGGRCFWQPAGYEPGFAVLTGFSDGIVPNQRSTGWQYEAAARP